MSLRVLLFTILLSLAVGDAAAQYVGPWKIMHNFRIYGKDAKPITSPSYRVSVDTSAAGVGIEDQSAPSDIHVAVKPGELTIEYYSSRRYTPRFTIDHGSERMAVESDFSLDSIPFQSGSYRATGSYEAVFVDQMRYHSRRLHPFITELPLSDSARFVGRYQVRELVPTDAYGKIESQRLWTRPNAPYGLGETWPPLANHRIVEGVYVVPKVGVVVLVRNSALSAKGTPPTNLFLTRDRGTTWQNVQLTSSRDSIYQTGSYERQFDFIDSLGTRRELWLTDSGTGRIVSQYAPSTPYLPRLEYTHTTLYSMRRGTMYSRIDQQILESRDTGMSWRPIFTAGPMKRLAWKDSMGAYFNSQYWAITRDDGENWYASPFTFYPSYFTDAIILDRKTVIAYGPECLVFVDFKD